MNPFNQTGFQTPFAFNTPSFGGPNWGFGATQGFNGFPFNQSFNTPFANQFGAPMAPSPINWNTPFNWNSGFNGGMNADTNWGATGMNPGFSAFPWSTPFNTGWNETPWNGFTPFSGFGGFSPFASIPFWGAQFPASFWNANNPAMNSGFNQSDNTPFNASIPVANGAFPFGFPFFAPGAFGPFGGAPTQNGEATPTRNAA